MQAVETAASQKVMILTGGPGTGKTFVTRTIVSLWKAMGKKIACAAPTGRAAKRLSEMTGIEAKTLHRLLEFDPSKMGFKRDLDNQLNCSAGVVDESSMVDLFMAHSLLKAIPKDALLLMVGDINQLPSVGPGNVLKDLIASEKIPVVRLTQVFRQAAQSAIIHSYCPSNQSRSHTQTRTNQYESYIPLIVSGIQEEQNPNTEYKLSVSLSSITYPKLVLILLLMYRCYVP